KWFDEAGKHFLSLPKDSPFRCYNMACMTSLKGDMEACHEWMKELAELFQTSKKKHMELPRTKIMMDPDLENARRQSWWGSIMTEIVSTGFHPTIGYGCAPQVYL